MVDYRYWTGRGSAATLGYITGNLQGARKADQIFTSYYRRMPVRSVSIARRRGRQRARSAAALMMTPTSQRRRSVSSVRSVSRGRRSSILTLDPPQRTLVSALATSRSASRAATNRISGDMTHGFTTLQPAVRYGKKKIKLPGLKKKVKVSTKLRKKIEKVIEAKKVHGYFQLNQINTWNPLFYNNQQNTVAWPVTGTFAGVSGGLFNPVLILHAASRLWNGKAVGTGSPILVEAGNFTPTDFAVNVNQQWWTFRIRNNSQRTQYLTVYKCQAKSTQNDTDAGGAWNEGLAQGIVDGSNVSGATAQMIHSTPFISKQFNQQYKAEKIDITLEPGQNHEFHVQGPKMLYDFQKFYDNTTYQRYQKFDIQLIWAAYGDLVFGSTVSGRAAESDTGELQIVESTYHCKMSLPDKAGFIFSAPAGGTNIELGNREYRYVYDNFAVTTTHGTELRIDPENPTLPTS